MSARGWRNHRVLDEGLPGWWERGYPVEGRRAGERPPQPAR